MESFLGETTIFWCRVRAAMRKARIDTPEALEERLGVVRPKYEVRLVDGAWRIIAVRPTQMTERVVGFGVNEPTAHIIALALAKADE